MLWHQSLAHPPPAHPTTPKVGWPGCAKTIHAYLRRQHLLLPFELLQTLHQLVCDELLLLLDLFGLQQTINLLVYTDSSRFIQTQQASKIKEHNGCWTESAARVSPTKAQPKDKLILQLTVPAIMQSLHQLPCCMSHAKLHKCLQQSCLGITLQFWLTMAAFCSLVFFSSSAMPLDLRLSASSCSRHYMVGSVIKQQQQSLSMCTWTTPPAAWAAARCRLHDCRHRRHWDQSKGLACCLVLIIICTSSSLDSPSKPEAALAAMAAVVTGPRHTGGASVLLPDQTVHDGRCEQTRKVEWKKLRGLECWGIPAQHGLQHGFWLR